MAAVLQVLAPAAVRCLQMSMSAGAVADQLDLMAALLVKCGALVCETA